MLDRLPLLPPLLREIDLHAPIAVLNCAGLVSGSCVCLAVAGDCTLFGCLPVSPPLLTPGTRTLLW